MASAQQSASTAGALQNYASGAQQSKFIPASIGLARQCERWAQAGKLTRDTLMVGVFPMNPDLGVFLT